jgi:hypothetical protein
MSYPDQGRIILENLHLIPVAMCVVYAGCAVVLYFYWRERT